MLFQGVAGIPLSCRSGPPDSIFSLGRVTAVVVVAKVFQCFRARFFLAFAARAANRDQITAASIHQPHLQRFSLGYCLYISLWILRRAPSPLLDGLEDREE